MIVKNILWDFDGVILDSMDVRDHGFRKIFKEYDNTDVRRLIEYHRANGGLSRYVKIRYFFEIILKKEVTETEIMEYANRFTVIMKQELINPQNLIHDSVGFIKKNYLNFNFHIVSGSDNEELNFLCKKLDLAMYFKSIHGSPTPKNTLVNNLISKNKYKIDETCLIGDSINDFEAANNNDIQFYGYNSDSLRKIGTGYINSFNTFSV